MLLEYYLFYITTLYLAFYLTFIEYHLYRYTKDGGNGKGCIPIPQKIYLITKRLKNPEEVERYFPGFLAFTDCTEQQIPRHIDKEKGKCTIEVKKRHTVKNQLTVYKEVLSSIKSPIKKEEDMFIMCTIIISLLLLKKLLM